MNKNQHNDYVRNQPGSRKRGRNTQANADNFKVSKPKVSPKQTCDFYEPDNSEGSNAIVLKVLFAHLSAAINEKKVACYFGSALCAFDPDFTTIVKKALEENGITLNVIKLPSEAADNAIDLNVGAQRDCSEALALIGSCLILLFKNVSQVNYDNFISKRVCALGGKVGLSKNKTQAFKFPLDFRQAKAVRDVLGSNNSLKKEVREYLIWLSDDVEEGLSCSMARYVRMFCVPPKPPSMTYDEAIQFLRRMSNIKIADDSNDDDA